MYKKRRLKQVFMLNSSLLTFSAIYHCLGNARISIEKKLHTVIQLGLHVLSKRGYSLKSCTKGCHATYPITTKNTQTETSCENDCAVHAVSALNNSAKEITTNEGSERRGYSKWGCWGQDLKHVSRSKTGWELLQNCSGQQYHPANMWV